MDSRICILLIGWRVRLKGLGDGRRTFWVGSCKVRQRVEGKKSLDHTKKGASQWTAQGTRRQDGGEEGGERGRRGRIQRIVFWYGVSSNYCLQKQN